MAIETFCCGNPRCRKRVKRPAPKRYGGMRKRYCGEKCANEGQRIQRLVWVRTGSGLW